MEEKDSNSHRWRTAGTLGSSSSRANIFELMFSMLSLRSWKNAANTVHPPCGRQAFVRKLRTEQEQRRRHNGIICKLPRIASKKSLASNGRGSQRAITCQGMGMTSESDSDGEIVQGNCSYLQSSMPILDLNINTERLWNINNSNIIAISNNIWRKEDSTDDKIIKPLFNGSSFHDKKVELSM